MAKPKRIQRKAEKGWRLPENTVYVGRGSKWGNPFPFDHQRYLGKAWAVAAYGQWLTTTLKGLGLVREHLSELRGKNLACWCHSDEPCHADLLLALANEEPAHAEAQPDDAADPGRTAKYETAAPGP